MIRFPSLALALAVAAASAAPAPAQERNHGAGELGSRLAAPPTKVIDDDRSRRLGKEMWVRFAPCFSEAMQSRAAALIGSVPASAEEGRIIDAGMARARKCFGISEDPVKFMFSSFSMRALVATSLEASTRGPVPAKIADDKLRAEWVLAGVEPIRDQNIWTSHFFARCVAADAPAETGALLASGAGTAGEAAAFKALQPAMGGCLPEGAKFNTERETLRGLMAEAMYKLSGAAAAGKAAE